MTSKEAAAIRLSVQNAIKTFDAHPDFPAIQVQIYERITELMKATSSQSPGTDERMQTAIKVLDIYAEGYLRFVTDMQSQKVYIDLLGGVGYIAAETYTGSPMEHMFLLPPNAVQIQQRVGHWTNEGFKRIASQPTAGRLEPGSIPARTISERLDDASIHAGISHEEQASRIGISRTAYFEVKAGRGGKNSRKKTETYLSKVLREIHSKPGLNRN